MNSMHWFIVILISAIAFVKNEAFQGPFRRLYPSGTPTVLNITDDPGEPLFLSTYLEQGRIDEAKQLRLILEFFVEK